MRIILLFIIFIGATLLIGCGDEEETSLLNPEETTFNFIGEMKRPKITNAPGAPQMPNAGTPTVTEVNYYSNWQMTEPLEGTLQAGTTIYTKVVFSEPMRHLVSDAGNALPVLFYVIGETETQYDMKPHGASGENFQSGDSKPWHGGIDDYICKYTVQADDQGAFTLKVGTSSVDTDGNTLTNHYVHGAVLQLGQPTNPEVTEVNYYSNWQMTEPVEGTVQAGTTIYTKVVFSEPMRHVTSDAGNALPVLFYVIGETETRYRMKPHGASGENFQSGDSKPWHDDTDDYICKYTVQADDQGTFTLKVGKSSADTDGNMLANHYVHDTVLSLAMTPEEPKPREEPGIEIPMESKEEEPLVVLEISHYSNGGLTKPLMGSVEAGRTVFTKVVFSEDVAYLPANDASAFPDIRYVLDGRETQYDVLPAETRRAYVRSGDCKPIYGGTVVFLCRKSIPGHATGEFSVRVNGVPFESASLMIETPPPPPVVMEPPPQPQEEGEEQDTNQVPIPTAHDYEPPPIEAGVTPQTIEPKTALQHEVKAAKEAGLADDSPLVRAIKIADLIFDRFDAAGKDAATAYPSVENIPERLQYFLLEMNKILEEEGMPPQVFHNDLSRIYTHKTGDNFDLTFTRKYWMTIEYLRITFEFPEESHGDQYTRLAESVRKGKVGFELRPRQ